MVGYCSVQTLCRHDASMKFYKAVANVKHFILIVHANNFLTVKTLQPPAAILFPLMQKSHKIFFIKEEMQMNVQYEIVI